MPGCTKPRLTKYVILWWWRNGNRRLKWVTANIGKQKEKPLSLLPVFTAFMNVSKPVQKCAISCSTVLNSFWWWWLGLKYKFHDFLQILEVCNTIFYALLIPIIITLLLWMSNVIRLHTHIFLLQMCPVTTLHFCKVSYVT